MGKNNLFKNIYEKIQNGQAQPSKGRPDLTRLEQKQPQIEEVTLDRYKELKADINIYKKLQQDYQKRLEQMQKQKDDEQNKKIQSRMKLIEKESELGDLQDELAKIKLEIKKLDLKPRQISNSVKDETVKNKPKQIVNYGKVKSIKSGSQANNSTIKYDQKGVKTPKGVKFTDRNILGKAVNSRIVGVKVWTEKFTYAICGIQCTYKIDQIQKVGGQHVNRLGISLYGQNSFQLEDGDYVKTISGSLSPSNVIEYLVFISINSKVARYGLVKPNQKQFIYDIQENQMPICVYGSLASKQEPGKPETSLIEQLGFEISLDNRPDKSSI